MSCAGLRTNQYTKINWVLKQVFCELLLNNGSNLPIVKNVSGEGLVLARGGVENNNEVNKKINNNIMNKEDI